MSSYNNDDDEFYQRFANDIESAITEAARSNLKPVDKHKQAVDGVVQDLITTTPFDNSPNQINQLGLGPKVIQGKRNGYSDEQIALSIGMDAKDVKKWWNIYQGLSPEQKRVVAKSMIDNSVFDIPQRMQELYDDLKSAADEIRDRNPSVYREFLAEVRMTLKQAKEIIEASHNASRYEDERNVIIEEISKESPECAKRIRKRLQEMKYTKGLL